MLPHAYSSSANVDSVTDMYTRQVESSFMNTNRKYKEYPKK